jgi:hypothetical protein
MCFVRPEINGEIDGNRTWVFFRAVVERDFNLTASQQPAAECTSKLRVEQVHTHTAAT